MSSVRNNTHFVVTALNRLLSEGGKTESRFGETIEILNYHCTIERPLERLIWLPGLTINIPAQIVDGWWILSGSNDIEVLQKYLPEAADRSDDDVTWRGGFGPRLRNWHGVDQLREVLKIIAKRPESRRASIALFDPLFDFHESKDVSTTNAIHFIVRDNKLHMSVDMRSADILGSTVPGGLTTNNLYEWSLLLEVMAHWSGYSVGQLHLYIHSLHLYQKDLEKAQNIISQFDGLSIYEKKPLQKNSFSTSFAQFNQCLDTFFETEKKLDSLNIEQIPALNDKLMDATLLYLWYSRHPEMTLPSKLLFTDFAMIQGLD